MKKRLRFAAYGTVAVAAVGVAAFAFTTVGTAPSSSSVAVEQASQEQPTDGTAAALPCEKVQELERSVQSRGAALPGPEQYPPFQPGFEPDAPAPEQPPLDPTTGKPKGSESQPAPRAAEPAFTEAQLSERPCGAVVDMIRDDTIKGGGWVCYLEDGRYASAIFVDAPKPIDTQEERDSICRMNGFARSVQ